MRSIRVPDTGGFTLIELTLVIVIGGILAGVGLRVDVEVRKIQIHLLRLAVARDGYRGARGGRQGLQHFHRAARVIQRRAIDGQYQIPGAQAELREGVVAAAAARKDAVAAEFALVEYRLYPHQTG